MERYDLPIAVPFIHRVCFTRDVFDAGNPLLHDLLAEGGGRRVLVFIEEAVDIAWPDLASKILGYFSHGSVMLCGVEVLAGGEPVKADDRLVRAVWYKI
jgi:3-dehydroquinate synthase